VDVLRQCGVADEITAAFWKEMPSFHTVLNTLTADDITILPLFTAQGYFTQTVIPAEMDLEGALTTRDGRIIRYARTLSEHPYLSAVVRQRVETALQTAHLPPEKTAVAIIGHSTRRNPESRKATEAQAVAIRILGLVAEVQAVYLDDEPDIASIYRLTTAPNLIAVPYFLASGSHTTIDVPHQLGLPLGQITGQVNGRQVVYTAPVGTDETLRDVILELAREADAPLNPPIAGTMWQSFPTAGRPAWIHAVQSAGVMRFGDLCVTPARVSLWGDETATTPITSPAELRQHVRDNPFRSLATSTDLPRGWYVETTNRYEICAAVETIYPGAVAAWAAHQCGALPINTFHQTIARQTGSYRRLKVLNQTEQAEIVGRVCGSCVRHPTWFHNASSPSLLPCSEPCNHWLSAALETQL
jgi:sirohydrochlorin cobaltochelatase